MSLPVPPFVRRVVIENYKSIRKCDVALGPLTVLVGPNGSGKSNFLDALRFLAEALRVNLDQAVQERGGVQELLYRGREEGRRFAIHVWVRLPDGRDAFYSMSVGDDKGLFVVEEENCRVALSGGGFAEYTVRRGDVVHASIPTPPASSEYQLYLTSVSGFPEFRDVFTHLKGMRFFNIEPDQIRKEGASSRPARELARNGEGARFALNRLVETNPEAKQRLEEYFRAILPAAAECKVATAPPYIGNYGTVVKPIGQDDLAEPQSLRFVFRFDGTVVAFGPHSLSDGTLRAFGILLALFQVRACSPRDPIPVVGIEEPEAALHPAAAGAMWDAMSEASHFTQVLVTTHSPDLLEVSDFDSESLVIVDMVDGETVLGEADEASKSILRDRLTTAGEMLRQNQLRAAPRPASPVDAST